MFNLWFYSSLLHYNAMTETFKRVPRTARIIGHNLRYLRESCHYSQKCIGDLLDVSYQQIQKYEQGTNRFPIEGLYKLKHFYNVPYEVFFRGFSQDESSGNVLSTETKEYVRMLIHLWQLRDAHLKSKIQRILPILMEPDS